MEIKSNLCSNATRKIGLLITKASELGMDVSGYGFADENTNSGNVYIWLEDYPFTLYIGLGSDTIYAMWTDFNDGEEHETEVEGKTLEDLEEWTNDLSAKAMGEDEEEELIWFTSSSYCIELRISLSDAQSCSHAGDCADDVQALAKVPYIADQLAKIDAQKLRDELKEYGAWDEVELSDHQENLHRLLWIACGDIVEQETSHA